MKEEEEEEAEGRVRLIQSYPFITMKGKHGLMTSIYVKATERKCGQREVVLIR